MKLDKDFWDNLYKDGITRWDIGHVSTPLKEYIDQIKDKNVKILIPGSGNSYEAQYLHEIGFKNTYVIDISSRALQAFKNRYPDFPEDNLICGDFFKHTGAYDIMIEQTFFCAIEPSLREAYADKVHELLNENGRLAGLLFDDPLNKDEPPYGGTKDEYKEYFKDKFDFKVFQTAYNSISPRQGREIFIILIRK